MHTAFERAIRETPDDDTPRLVYADYLEGDCYPPEPERAEFIRLSVEAAKLSHTHRPGHPGGCLRCRLRRRADRLLDADPGRALSWFGLPRPWARVVRTSSFDSVPDDYPYAIARRGFLEQVVLPFDIWHEHGKEIRAAHPLRRVTLPEYPAFDRLLNTADEMVLVRGPGGIPVQMGEGLTVTAAVKDALGKEWKGLAFDLPMRYFPPLNGPEPLPVTPDLLVDSQIDLTQNRVPWPAAG